MGQMSVKFLKWYLTVFSNYFLHVKSLYPLSHYSAILLVFEYLIKNKLILCSPQKLGYGVTFTPDFYGRWVEGTSLSAMAALELAIAALTLKYAAM